MIETMAWVKRNYFWVIIVQGVVCCYGNMPPYKRVFCLILAVVKNQYSRSKEFCPRGPSIKRAKCGFFFNHTTERLCLSRLIFGTRFVVLDSLHHSLLALLCLSYICPICLGRNGNSEQVNTVVGNGFFDTGNLFYVAITWGGYEDSAGYYKKSKGVYAARESIYTPLDFAYVY